MARRRRKSKDADLILPIVVLSVIFLYANPQFLKSNFIFGFIALVVIAVVAIFKSEKIISLDTEFDNSFNRSASGPQVKPKKWSLELINSLDWKVFEDLCAAYFVAKGYKAKVTDFGADGGVDVLLYSQTDANTVVGVVQCKAWSKRQIGVKDIRELYGIMADRNCPMGVFITTSGYTEEAKAFAENKHIKLINSNEIYSLINILPKETQQRLFDEIITEDYSIPSCPNCGIKLTVRTSRKQGSAGYKFWGCKKFPRCRYKMKMRKAA